MTRTFQVCVLALIVVFCFGTLAVAADHAQFSAKVVRNSGARANSAHPDYTFTYPAKGLYGVAQWFGGGPIASYATPTNGDGSEIWPCFGGGTASNPDCPTVGSPVQPLAADGFVGGVPFYGWPLQFTSGSDFCDQASTADAPCGQVETWYEDDSLDGTDDLLYLLTALQGTKYLSDSGTYDFGPNFTGGGPGAVVVISGDQGFGTMGQTGVNNGNCAASFAYPLAAPAYPGVYEVSAKKTCSAPTTGLVKFTALTELGTPAYTKVTTVAGCSPVAPPCYTVKWTIKYKATQTWNIWLE